MIQTDIQKIKKINNSFNPFLNYSESGAAIEKGEGSLSTFLFSSF